MIETVAAQNDISWDLQTEHRGNAAVIVVLLGHVIFFFCWT
jgi:hypothetical protein